MQYPGRSSRNGRTVPVGVETLAGRLNPHELYTGIVNKSGEDAHRIRPAPDTGHYRFG